ncbi:MAG: C10 family peptidase [Clostridium sp.]|nr:C10 family peptidase [Clostridium sp.]
MLSVLGADADGADSKEIARNVASRFWNNRLTSLRQIGDTPGEVLSLHRSDITSRGECHLFIPPAASGFVLVANVADAMQVVGYSTESRLDGSDLPEPLVNLMRGFALTRYSYGQTSAPGGRAAISVAPLLHSKHSQYEPYNGLCPYYTYDNGSVSTARCLVGCVATAIEGVMNYYRYPECLRDTLHGWSTPHYTLDTVPPGTPIHWEQVLNDYNNGYTEEQARAVQEISLYCAMAAHMNFGLSASGANTEKAAPQLSRVFGYGTSVFRSRMKYTPVAWNAMLNHELTHGRPVVYVGHNYTGGGHCFVIDGQDADGLYHLNWGYGGDADGYYCLDVLNPYERADDFTPEGLNQGLYCNHGALLLHPDSVEVLSPDTLVRQRNYVTVDNVTFSRTPDTSGYVPAYVTLTNHMADSVTYTCELFTCLPTDTDVYEQGIGVGICGITLPPHTTAQALSYCRFNRSGEQILGVADEDTIVYSTPLDVKAGTAGQLVLTQPAVVEVKADAATFAVDITNCAVNGSSGNWITYTIYYEDEPTGRSHWGFAEIPAGETHTQQVAFHHLRPDSRYTLKVRYPWTIVGECTIHTPPATGLNTVGVNEKLWQVYTLSGIWQATVSDAEWNAFSATLPPALYILKSMTGDSRKVCVGRRP